MAQAIKFKNFTNEDFTYSFDGVPYTFKGGETIYLEDFKAKHFAKHLVDRELNKLNIPTNNLTKRAELEKKCFTDEAPVTTEEALNIEETKKEIKKTQKEEEFPDLQEPISKEEVAPMKVKKVKK